jgi:hypothetical protein
MSEALKRRAATIGTRSRGANTPKGEGWNRGVEVAAITTFSMEGRKRHIGDLLINRGTSRAGLGKHTVGLFLVAKWVDT